MVIKYSKCSKLKKNSKHNQVSLRLYDYDQDV